MEACGDLNSPVILQAASGTRKYASHTYLIKLVEAAVAKTPVLTALHLDHGVSFELCTSCLDGGFKSVLIDGSHLPIRRHLFDKVSHFNPRQYLNLSREVIYNMVKHKIEYVLGSANKA